MRGGGHADDALCNLLVVGAVVAEELGKVEASVSDVNWLYPLVVVKPERGVANKVDRILGLALVAQEAVVDLGLPRTTFGPGDRACRSQTPPAGHATQNTTNALISTKLVATFPKQNNSVQSEQLHRREAREQQH